MGRIANPWGEFEYGPYMVHPDDVVAFEAHNSRAKRLHQFIPFLTPEPWIGNVEAQVVVLLANPSVTNANLAGQPELNEFRKELSILNLQMKKIEYLHYFLDPRLVEDPGGKWWRRSLGQLIKATSLENVARNLLSIESLPYHSKQFESPRIEIPSQQFSNQILRDSMERGAFVVVYRESDYWFSQVDELRKYPYKTVGPGTTQSVWITPGNLRNGFEEIVERINA